MKKVSDDNRCFVCGQNNDRGLRFKFSYNERTEESESTIVFADYYQGWGKIVHGGLVSTILDEIQVKVAGFHNYQCLTAELNVKYKKPVRTETEYFLTGKIKKIRNKIVYTEASLKDKNSNTVAFANAKLFIVTE